jgi:hypothetical protein
MSKSRDMEIPMLLTAHQHPIGLFLACFVLLFVTT